MNFIFPMMGLSSRFLDYGFKLPKYMLPYGNKTILEEVILSFEKYFTLDFFYFILKSDNPYIENINKSLRKIGLNNYRLLFLDNYTLGQADTIFKVLNEFPVNEPITVFNIDTILLNFKKLDNQISNTYLELFVGEGSHWSFAEIKKNKVIRVVEKNRISQYCSNGLYCFDEPKIFLESYNFTYKNFQGERYVAPLYNFIINSGILVDYKIVSDKDMIFVGTPHEYNEAIRNL